jgi:uncharacterized membrane protein
MIIVAVVVAEVIVDSQLSQITISQRVLAMASVPIVVIICLTMTRFLKMTPGMGVA